MEIDNDRRSKTEQTEQNGADGAKQRTTEQKERNGQARGVQAGPHRDTKRQKHK